MPRSVETVRVGKGRAIHKPRIERDGVLHTRCGAEYAGVDYRGGLAEPSPVTPADARAVTCRRCLKCEETTNDPA